MNNHIQFMKAFLAGLKSLPNPDKYTQAYIRAFEMCLYSAEKNNQEIILGGHNNDEHLRINA
jgi:hypothetical protein